MPKIKFVHGDGHIDEVDAEVGRTLMEAATDQGVNGIVAECGGSIMCATCHVYVDPNWMSIAGTRNEIEDEMLNDTLAERRDNSRLSCQIAITAEMDGFVVHVPS